MDAAWSQIGEVLEAQRRIRLGQFGLLVSQIWYDRHLLPTVGVSRQQALLLIAPLNKRVLDAAASRCTTTMTRSVRPADDDLGRAAPRSIRPRGRLIQSLPFDAGEASDRSSSRA